MFILSYELISMQVYYCVIILQTSTIALQSHVKMAVSALTWSLATDVCVYRDTSEFAVKLVGFFAHNNIFLNDYSVFLTPSFVVIK